MPIWNWKSALLSVILRVPVFALATLRNGAVAVAGAVVAEVFVCAVYAGFYAAVVQFLRNRKPVWLVATVIAVVLPAIGQVIEYSVHAWHGTPHRTVAVIISSVLSALAALFNWYAMKQGSLLVGQEKTSFLSDLRRIPVLIFRFVLLAPRWLGRQFGETAVPSN